MIPSTQGSGSPAQSLLQAGINILSCVILGNLFKFSVPHFPICPSVAKAGWHLGHNGHYTLACAVATQRKAFIQFPYISLGLGKEQDFFQTSQSLSWFS